MRNLITIINLSIIIGITTILTRYDKASTQIEKEQVEEKMPTYSEVAAAVKSDFTHRDKHLAKSPVNATVVDYLIQLNDGRQMDLEEGKTAQQRGTSRELKDYGTLMVKDQTAMLKDLKEIAERKNVTIPGGLSHEKAEGLKELKSVHGREFDRKFIKMMVIDHKRDVRMLEKVIKNDDADLQVFATKYLPIVQSHLDKIKALRSRID